MTNFQCSRSNSSFAQSHNLSVNTQQSYSSICQFAALLGCRIISTKERTKRKNFILIKNSLDHFGTIQQQRRQSGTDAGERGKAMTLSIHSHKKFWGKPLLWGWGVLNLLKSDQLFNLISIICWNLSKFIFCQKLATQYPMISNA